MNLTNSWVARKHSSYNYEEENAMEKFALEILAVIYLFLSEQGRMDNETMEIFDSIADITPGYEKSQKGKIIGKCEQDLANLSEKGKAVSDYIIELTAPSYIWDWTYNGNVVPPFEKTFIRRYLLWELVNLIYYHGEYTEGKTAIINGLIAAWSDVDESVFLEMKDTAETYAALNSYGDLLDQTGHFSRAMNTELEASRADLDKSIEALIALG
jgi:hypothetical protein